MNLLLLGIGIGAGVLSGVFGVGGGIVIVPALIYLARMSPQQAAGTSLAALVLPIGVAIGATTYYRAGYLNIRDAVFIAIGMAVGAYFGAVLSTSLDATVLRRAFSVLLAILAVRLWFN